MTDPFTRPTLDSNAVDLAWVRYHYEHLPINEALHAMEAGGITLAEARLLLDAHRLPSTSGALAGAL